MQARAVRGRRAVIVDEYFVAVPLQLLRKKKSGGFFGDVSVRLVRKAEDDDSVLLCCQLLHTLQKFLLREFIDAIRSECERCFQSGLARRISQEAIVARKTWTAIAQASTKIFFPDARVAAERIEHHVDVRFRKLLGDHPKLVREADLHRDVAVERNFRQLRADDRHAHDLRLVTIVFFVSGFERFAVFGMRFTDEYHIWIEQSIDDIAKRDELRVVAEAEIRTTLPTGLFLQHRNQNGIASIRRRRGPGHKQIALLAALT